MNQLDLIQKIIAMEQQAQALTHDANTQLENLEFTIQSEISALEIRYQEESQKYLDELAHSQQIKSIEQLQALETHLAERLAQIDDIYAARKHEWINTIFERIVGKAGA